MSINECPIELLALIVDRIPGTNKELRILRGVNRTFCALITPLVFRRVYVKDRLASALDLKALMERDELAKAVESIVFRWAGTPDDIEDEWTERASHAVLELVFMQLHRFPALIDLELNLCSDMWPSLHVDDSGHVDLNRHPSEAGILESTLMQAILRGTRRPRLKSLALVNLLAYPWPYYKSDEFAEVLSSIEHLRLDFHGIFSVAGDGGEEMMRRLWEEAIPVDLLGPTQARLTSLTLMSDQPVGRWPRVDLSPFFFPMLRYLELGGITFDHDRLTEDFIVRHGQTLTSLVLDSCPMYIGSTVHGPLRPWREVCDRFAETLEVLVDAQFHRRERDGA
ncbi:hypothetical protein C8Q73DRAFT_690181 [Cubamyces lactineus]|nr:hypothetical protein C8Q73DRAFT_690181 [Cubamyces lactineus]